jgi:hypothetical protein
VLNFIQTAQPGDALALSTDACCEMRQGIWLQAERAVYLRAERAMAWRDLMVYCENEVPKIVRHGGAAEVLRVAHQFALRTGREVMA